MTPTEALILSYNEKIEFFKLKIQKEKSKVNTIFYSRLIAFILGFVLFFLFIQSNRAIAFILVPAIIAVFLILLKLELKAQRNCCTKCKF